MNSPTPTNDERRPGGGSVQGSDSQRIPEGDPCFNDMMRTISLLLALSIMAGMPAERRYWYEE